MRQTNFFQAKEDEQELLQLILGSAPAGREVVLLDTTGARSPAEVRSYGNPVEVPLVGADGRHEVLYAALLGGDLEVVYHPTATYRSPGRGGGIRVDPSVSPVFEFQRCSRMRDQLLRGRLYAFEHDLVPAGDGLQPFAKSQELKSWFNGITRWVRARYVPTDPPGPFLVGPHAAAWHRQGGQLAECGFRYRIAEG